MTFLSSAELIWLNEDTLLSHGGLYISGDDTVANGDSLSYLVEAIPGVMYGVEPYEGLYRKAAAYAYHIITRHVFRDGNKRTGMRAAFLFLRINGSPVISATDDEIVGVAVGIAESKVELDTLAEWLEKACTAQETC